MKKAFLSLAIIVSPIAGLAFAQTDSIEPADPIELYEQGPEALEPALAKEMTDEKGWANSFWKGAQISASSIDLSQIAQVNLRSDGTAIESWSFSPDISANGEFVSFVTNIRAAQGNWGDYGVFQISTNTGNLTNISDLPSGRPVSLRTGFSPIMSDDGCHSIGFDYCSCGLDQDCL